MKNFFESHDEKVSESVKEIQTRLDAEKAQLEQQLAHLTEQYKSEINALTEENQKISNNDSAPNVTGMYSFSQQPTPKLAIIAETASTNLLALETNWNAERELLNTQINSLKIQLHDALLQETELHKKLAEQSQKDVPPSYEESAKTTESLRQTVDELRKDIEALRAINSQLQEEKEIFETNQNLTEQELKRLRRNLDYKISEVEGYKIDLQNVTERKVQPLVDDVNIVKESNIALREQRGSEFSKQAVNLGEELEKLKGVELQFTASLSELKEKDDSLKELTTWKAKFNGMEPEQVNALKTENDTLKQAKASLTTQLLSQRNSASATLKLRLAAKSQDNTAELQQKLGEAEAKATKFETDSKTLEVRLNNLRNEFQEKMNARRAQSKEQLLAATTANNKLLEEVEALKKAATEQAAHTTVQSEALNQTKQNVTDLESALQTKEGEVKAAKAQIAEHETELQNLKSQVSNQISSNDEVDAERQKLALANEQISLLETEKLNQADLVKQLQADLDSVKAALATATAPTATPTEESAGIDSSVTATKVAELEGQVKELTEKLSGFEELEKQKNALESELQNVPARVAEAIKEAESAKATLQQQLETLQAQQQQSNDNAAGPDQQREHLNWRYQKRQHLSSKLKRFRLRAKSNRSAWQSLRSCS